MCGVDTDGGREGGRVRSETAATHGEVRERECHQPAQRSPLH